MNCPLCGTIINDEDKGICPNCGTPLPSPETEEAPEIAPASAEMAASGRRTGIFYETLAASQEVYEEEHQPKKASRFASGEIRGFVGMVFLLLVFLGTVYGFSQIYDPDAAAIIGSGGVSMTNGEFSVYYLSAYQSYLSDNSDSIPFDTSRSLKKQYYNVNEGYSWEDYFIDTAFSSAAATACIRQAAEDAGFTLSEADQAECDAAIESMDSTAEAGGYSSTDAYLTAAYGIPMTRDIYAKYIEDSYVCQGYTEYLYSTFEFTDDEILAYYMSHSDDYSGLTMSNVPNVNIRQILIVPEDDSEAALSAAQETAQGLSEELNTAGNTPEAFSDLAAQYSDDTGSRDNGGLLENVSPGALGDDFDVWCFDEALHDEGDVAILQSSYGWHLVRFESYTDTVYWESVVLADMRTEALTDYVQNLYYEADCRLTHFAMAPEGE